MKDPTGILGVEMSQELITSLRMLPSGEIDQFLQRCKDKEYLALDGALTDADRFRIQCNVQFVNKFKNFFESLLTKPH